MFIFISSIFLVNFCAQEALSLYLLLCYCAWFYLATLSGLIAESLDPFLFPIVSSPSGTLHTLLLAHIMPSTPPTSPQHHQAATRQSERDSRVMGSPEQRRIPTAPSTSAAPLPPPPPSLTSVTFNGQTYNHLPSNLAAMAAAIPSFPVIQWRFGHLPAASMLAPSPVSLI